MVARALAIDFKTPARARLAIGKILTSFAAWSFAIGLAVYGFEAHGIVGVGVVALIRYLPGARRRTVHRGDDRPLLAPRHAGRSASPGWRRS